MGATRLLVGWSDKETRPGAPLSRGTSGSGQEHAVLEETSLAAVLQSSLGERVIHGICRLGHRGTSSR
jgi:hypothetical protein